MRDGLAELSGSMNSRQTIHTHVVYLVTLLLLFTSIQSSFAIDTRNIEIPKYWDAETKEEFWRLLAILENETASTKEQCQVILQLSDRFWENRANDVFRELLGTSTEELIQRTTIYALSRSKYLGGKSAFPELLKALREGNPAIKLRAAYLIESVFDVILSRKEKYTDDEFKQFQVIYDELINDPNVEVRNLFRFVWPDYEPPNKGFEQRKPDLSKVVPILKAAFKIERENPIPFEQQAKIESSLSVLFAFGELGPEGEFAIPILINELKSITDIPTGFSNHGDLEATYADNVIGALTQIGEASLPELRRLLKSDQEVQQTLAAIAIPHIDPTDKQVIPILLNSLEGNCWGIHTYAVDYRRDGNSLALMGNLVVVPYMNALRENKDLKKFDYQILKGISYNHDFTNLILPYLEDPNPTVRTVAVWGLSYQDDRAKGSLPKLKNLLQTEEDEDVTKALKDAIKKLSVDR